MKLNLNKTEIIPLGTNIDKMMLLPDNIKSIQIKNGPFKALGVWFTNEEDESITLNFSEQIKNMQKNPNIWSCRSRSLKGKITILLINITPNTILTWNDLCPEENSN